MRDVKLTILKCNFDEELAKEYGVPGLTPCPVHTPGQVFISKGGNQPEGMCGGAWTACAQMVLALACGKDVDFYDSTWVNQKELAIQSCNDGLRTVIIKVEPAE